MTRASGVFRTWLAALLLASAALVVVPTTAHASGAGTLTALVNSARSAAGLQALRVNGSLAAVAQGWAEHMAAADELSHNPSTPAQIPAGWRAWGENVGFSTSPSASGLHSAFMASPEHRANVLGRSFTDVGVGYATKHGHTYVSEVFAGYGSPAAPKSSAGKSSAGKSSGTSTGRSPRKSASTDLATSSSNGPTTRSRAAARPSSGTTSMPTPPEAVRTAAPPVSTDLRLGATGPRVWAVQRELRVHGRVVVVDGDFGRRTDRAVRAFQDAAGLPVDGVVGSRTGAALAAPPTSRERAAARADARRDHGADPQGAVPPGPSDATVASVVPSPVAPGILAPGLLVSGVAAARPASAAASRDAFRTADAATEAARFPRRTADAASVRTGTVALVTALVVLAALATARLAAVRSRRRGGRGRTAGSPEGP